MDSNALAQLLSEVNGSSPMSVTLAPAEGSEVAQARRVTENDWRLTLKGTQSLADRLEAVIDDHAAMHPQVHLQAMLRVDDSMRPRRIDLLMPSGQASRGHAPSGTFGLVPVQAI